MSATTYCVDIAQIQGNSQSRNIFLDQANKFVSNVNNHNSDHYVVIAEALSKIHGNDDQDSWMILASLANKYFW